MARQVQPHGTTAAYMRHRNAKQKPCDACREAWNAYQRDRRMDPDVRMATRESERVSRVARYRALSRLAEQHPGEYRALLTEEREKYLAGEGS